MYVPSTARNSEFILVRAPAHVSRSAIDAQQHESRLPNQLTRLRVGGLRPYIGIPVLRCSDDAIGVRCPIDRCDYFVVLSKYTYELLLDAPLVDAYLRKRLSGLPFVSMLPQNLRFI